MNLVAFGLILICCHAWAIEIDDNFLVGETYKPNATKLEDFLERFKSSIRNGNETLGIPKLDPFTADKVPIKIKNGYTDLDITLTDVREDGLSSYEVNSADYDLNDLTFHIDLNWPLVNASTNYDMIGKVSGYKVFGKGEIHAAAHYFRVQVKIKFVLKDEYIQVEQISTKISLKAFDFVITGLYNNDDISKMVSETVSDMVPKIINQKEFSNEVNRNLKKILNENLSKITFEDLKLLLKWLGL